jgi:hypothetical protein
LESILALFLLTVASLLVVNLFQTALQRSRLGEQEHIARLIAESTMTELRAWSANGGFKQVSDLSSQDGRSFQDPEHSAYQVTITMKPSTLQTFCTELEKSFPGDERTLTESCAKTEVSVAWSSGTGQRSLRLASLIPESPRLLETVEISGVPANALNPGETVTLTAKALDDQGKEIKDIYFTWWVEAQSGVGLIVPARRSQSASFTNRARYRNGSTGIVNGTCRVAALATFEGTEVTGYSSNITLSP